jgi:hypothetical protein
MGGSWWLKIEGGRGGESGMTDELAHAPDPCWGYCIRRRKRVKPQHMLDFYVRIVLPESEQIIAVLY